MCVSTRQESRRYLGGDGQAAQSSLHRRYDHDIDVVHQGRHRGMRAHAQPARADRLRRAGRALLAGVRGERKGRRSRFATSLLTVRA